MKIKSGVEIVDTHKEYEAKISELESAMGKLVELSYTRSVLESQLNKLREELKALETTRFQALEPVTIGTSTLGGHEYYTHS